MNFANKISTFRILSVPFFIASLVYYANDPTGRWYLRLVALAIFLLAVVSDAVDGYIARRSREHSPAGLILDPLGDKLLLMSAFVCLYFIPLPIRFPLPVILIVLSRDILILLGAIVIFIVKQEIKVMPTAWGKLTTTFQMLAVAGVLLQFPHSYALWWIAAAFTVISGADYIRRGFSILYGLDNGRNIN